MKLTLYKTDDGDWQPEPDELAAMEEPCIMTIGEFWGAVDVGAFTEDDGYGYGGDGTEFWSDCVIGPADDRSAVPAKVTHINWCNR